MKSYKLSAGYIDELKSSLAEAAGSKAKLYDAIVNAPFKNKNVGFPLGLGLMVLVLKDEKQGLIKRTALSETEPAKGAVEFSVLPFKAINIPLTETANLLVKAVQTGERQATGDWKDTFRPILTPEEAHFNQAGAGIGSTVIYPFTANGGGALSFSYSLPLEDITEQYDAFMLAYTRIANDILSTLG